jgi:hypothetical protein
MVFIRVREFPFLLLLLIKKKVFNEGFGNLGNAVKLKWIFWRWI